MPDKDEKPTVTEHWVGEIKTYLNDQVRQQVGNEQYELIIDALVEDLQNE